MTAPSKVSSRSGVGISAARAHKARRFPVSDGAPVEVVEDGPSIAGWAVEQTLAEGVGRQIRPGRLQTGEVRGVDTSMKDAVQFKFLSAPLTDAQLKELIRIP